MFGSKGKRKSRDSNPPSNMEEGQVQSKNRWPLAILAILILGALVVLLWGLRQRSIKKEQPKCSDSVLVSANKAMKDKSYVAKLQPIVKDIQKIDDYEQDVNCLYYVTTYYTSMSDLPNAQLYLTKLKNLYEPSRGYSHIIDSPKSLDEMTKSVEFLKEQSKNIKIFYGPNK